MRIYLFSVLMFLLASGCSQNEATDGSNNSKVTPMNAESMKVELKKMEDHLMSQSKTNKFDKEIAAKLVDQSEKFATAFPKDPMTPSYAFRAAEVANSIKKYGKAIKLFALVHREYPEHEKAEAALFFEAFTFENNLKDKENAIKFYNEFLQRYPESKFAEDVRISIKNIDKTPEQLIEEFKKNNK